MTDSRFFIVGGAGFIGSHFTDRLLAGGAAGVTLYDNFSSGREWHYAHHQNDSRLRVVRGDVKDFAAIEQAMRGHQVVIHLASNPDIARAATEPDIDFREGTFLTQQVVEAMRVTGTPRLLYASAVESMETWANWKSPKITGHCCRFQPTAPASSRVKL